MRPESHVPLTPRMEEAVHELKRLITARFPYDLPRMIAALVKQLVA